MHSLLLRVLLAALLLLTFPADSVADIHGFFAGAQTVFSLPEEASRAVASSNGLIILGWCIVLLFGLLYGLSPRLRKRLPRYFWNHRFYQDAIRRGRKTISVETTLLLLNISTAVGLTTAVWLALVQQAPAFTILMGWLPESLGTVFTGLIERAWITVILAGGTTGLAVILWAGWLMFIAHRLNRPISYEQTFMLAVWPLWTMLPAAGLAWIIAGTAQGSGWMLFSLWLIGALYATLRTWIDFQAVTRIRSSYILMLLPGSPIILLLLTVAFLAYEQSSEAVLLWHLISQS